MQNHLHFYLLSEKKDENYKTAVARGLNGCEPLKKERGLEGVQELGAEEGIWPCEGTSNRRMEKAA